MCTIHAKKPQPKFCHDCAREQGPLKLEMTDTVIGVVERVLGVCPATGRQIVKLRLTGPLPIDERADPWV